LEAAASCFERGGKSWAEFSAFFAAETGDATMVFLNYLREAGFLALPTAPHKHFFLDFWREVVLVVACVPLVYYVIATLAVVRFFSKKRVKPRPFTPPVSVLKPVRGVDFASYKNFRSFGTQDYPEYESLLWLNDLEDEAAPI